MGVNKMTHFADTDAGAKFIASGASRETSSEIMEAIAFFARDENEAEDFWNGGFDGRVDFLSIWEKATGSGNLDAAHLAWGDQSLAQVMAESA
jgi:hypothetical protein